MYGNIIIDSLTPCLREVATGRIFQTNFSVAEYDEVIVLREQGWKFNWTDKALESTIVYKLTIRNDEVIQGLIAVGIDKSQHAIHVILVESAPHNLQSDKQYEGVGGHLFAIAIKLSFELGFGGFVYMDAKNEELAEHYSQKLGAVRIKSRIHEYRMAILEDKAKEILETYTLEGDLSVK